MHKLKIFLFALRGKIEFLINYISFKKCKVKYKSFPVINGKLFLRNNNGEIIIGKNLRVNTRPSANPIGGDTRTVIVVGKNAVLEIGDNVGISNSAIVCQKSIRIGNDVLIGGGCKIWDTDFHPIDPIKRKENNLSDIKCSNIEICDNAFIGGNSIILKGVRIGKNCVIGAGSVVTKDVPDNEIWAGNPAKFIKKISDI